MVISGGLRFGGAVWQRGTIEHQQVSTLFSLQSHLGSRLSSALAYPLKTRSGAKKIIFSGYPDRVVFIGSAVAADKKSILYLHELTLDKSKGNLRLKTTPFDPGKTDLSSLSKAETSILPAKYDQIRISYYGGDENSWNTSWLNKQELPKLIKLEMISGKDPAVDPHELIIELGKQTGL